MKGWLCLLLGSLPAFAASVDGKWSIAMPGVGEIVMELKTAGDALTGSIAGPNGVLEIVNGAVSGETISFQIVGAPANRRVTVTYTGKLGGDEIELTGRAEPAGGEMRM